MKVKVTFKCQVCAKEAEGEVVMLMDLEGLRSATPDREDVPFVILPMEGFIAADLPTMREFHRSIVAELLFYCSKECAQACVNLAKEPVAIGGVLQKKSTVH